ncbi:MAG: hypothetical protein J6X66_04030 [Lachnospiraceae bacterium]|nr:hypothetical protein [Lachnospiraceae bacterium]
MAIDVLEKEIMGLSEADMKLLIEFVHYLKFRINDTSSQEGSSDDGIGTKRKIGFLSDAFVSISSDFDETPDCMKEYI